MNQFLLDASALVKRFVPERGTPLLHHLFTRVPQQRLLCLMLGAAEVMAALVRKRNSGRLGPSLYATAVAELRSEVIDAVQVAKLPADNALINASIPLLERHPIDASDAIVLQTALDVVLRLRAIGEDIVLVTADRRLLRASQAEGLVTFDPETQSQADLDALIGP